MYGKNVKKQGEPGKTKVNFLRRKVVRKEWAALYP